MTVRHYAKNNDHQLETFQRCILTKTRPFLTRHLWYDRTIYNHALNVSVVVRPGKCDNWPASALAWYLSPYLLKGTLSLRYIFKDLGQISMLTYWSMGDLNDIIDE